MQQADRRSLWDLTANAGLSERRFVADATERVAIADLAYRSNLPVPREALRGQSVLIWCERQLPAVLALLQLDGIARRLALCPPDVPPAHLPAVIVDAEIDVVVSDGAKAVTGLNMSVPVVACETTLRPNPVYSNKSEHVRETEWLLFTSGTTGRPKLVVHTLSSLTGPLDDGLGTTPDAVWSTFYDVRRYGGLQILLRALLGGGSMLLSQPNEPIRAFLTRVGQCGVTHISGTPSHWRQALISGVAHRVSPRYVRLSGEVADQAILDGLAAKFSTADIAHAFASTEAGVAFDVRDNRAGFPATLVGQMGAQAEMRIVGGTLRIRSTRTASRYLGEQGFPIDQDGFVDTSDIVDLRGNRYYFVGRREGVINVGGQKVHPEEVEAVINQHPAVQMSRVWGRPSPITGALVVADIVTRATGAQDAFPLVKEEVLSLCNHALPPHKVPVLFRNVASISIGGSGKLVRHA
jgi:acyl-CoA synthetase (AMP-forming)/AMP-acid ligase II